MSYELLKRYFIKFKDETHGKILDDPNTIIYKNGFKFTYNDLEKENRIFQKIQNDVNNFIKVNNLNIENESDNEKISEHFKEHAPYSLWGPFKLDFLLYLEYKYNSKIN